MVFETALANVAALEDCKIEVQITLTAGPRNHLDLQCLFLRREGSHVSGFGHRQDPCEIPTELDVELPIHRREYDGVN